MMNRLSWMITYFTRIWISGLKLATTRFISLETWIKKQQLSWNILLKMFNGSDHPRLLLNQALSDLQTLISQERLQKKSQK
jgi:hypothetical protein